MSGYEISYVGIYKLYLSKSVNPRKCLFLCLYMPVYLGICQYEIWYPSMSQDILMQLNPGWAAESCAFCTLLARLKAAHLLLLRDSPGQAQNIFFLGVC
jgi:hypothetical protein